MAENRNCGKLFLIYQLFNFVTNGIMALKLLLSCFIVFFLIRFNAFGQIDTAKKPEATLSSKSMLKDTLDQRLDFSRFLIDANGFIPVPFIVTEPALGGFGLAVVPMFLTPKKRPHGFSGYIPPDITAGFGLYTANDSWALGGIRIGSIPGKGIKYRVGGGIADLNLSFYRETENVGEKEFAFSVNTIPIILSFSKRVLKQDVYLGLQYFFAKNKLTALFADSLPQSIDSDTFNSNIGSLGIFGDWDKRDNFFTADNGFRINALYTLNDSWTGSDFSYQRLSGFINWFIPFEKRWISGFRGETHFVFGDPPFYVLPSLAMRGVPAVRFQGHTTALIEN
ncbi:MAG TPA: hypothetical protein VKA49_22850 [Flavitalea sp.]|nr:hypothetical protein [Flavitalea sp.]